jgi:hypothetical protein
MIAGTTVSSASTFEKKRDRQSCQKGPWPQPPTSSTKPASRKHDTNTPTIEPKTNTPTWRESSNRRVPPVRRRMQVAPISAWEQLLMK